MVSFCISLITNEVKHLFTSFGIRISSSKRGLFIFFAHFSSRFSFFFKFIDLTASGLSCGMWDLLCVGIFHWGVGFSLVAAHGFLSSCGLQALECTGLFDPSRIEPASLALQGGFLTTGPQGKPPIFFLIYWYMRFVYFKY